MDARISVSAMAKLHGLSRQTLIHYDRIGLFKPLIVDKKGYRYYSERQIPYLRKIVFLKSLGLSLDAIKEQLQQTNPKDTLERYIEYKHVINEKIAALNQVRESLNQQINILGDALDGLEMKQSEPFIKYFPERKVIYKEFPSVMTKEDLHLTLMELWGQLADLGIRPSAGFGALLQPSNTAKTNSDMDFIGGSCIFVPYSMENVDNLITLPAGNYACMYKYGMPYNPDYIGPFLHWIDKAGYKIAGPIIDACLLDTTYYQSDTDVDFCMLQVLVRKREQAKEYQ